MIFYVVIYKVLKTFELIAISRLIHINTNDTECADVVRAKWCEISFTLQGSITEIILKEHQSYYSHVCQYAITWLLHIPIGVTQMLPKIVLMRNLLPNFCLRKYHGFPKG